MFSGEAEFMALGSKNRRAYGIFGQRNDNGVVRIMFGYPVGERFLSKLSMQ